MDYPVHERTHCLGSSDSSLNTESVVFGCGLSCLREYEYHVCTAHGGQRRALYSLELELQKGVGQGT